MGSQQSGGDNFGEPISIELRFARRHVFQRPGKLPRFQDLQDEDMYVITVSSEILVHPSRELKSLLHEFVVVSHRWAKSHHPDPSEEQRKAIWCFLEKHPEKKYVWLDWTCLPQPQKDEQGLVKQGLDRTREENAYFKSVLQHINTIFLLFDVLILWDQQAGIRFWCKFECFCAMHAIRDGSIVTLQRKEAEQRYHVVFTGSLAHGHWDAGMQERKLRLVWEEHGGIDVNKMLDYLQSEDLQVTNQSDIGEQVSRVKFMQQNLGDYVPLLWQHVSDRRELLHQAPPEEVVHSVLETCLETDVEKIINEQWDIRGQLIEMSLSGLRKPGAGGAVVAVQQRLLQQWQQRSQAFAQRLADTFFTSFRAFCTIPSDDVIATFDAKKLVSMYPETLTSKYEILEQIGSGAQGVTHRVKRKDCPLGEDTYYVAKEKNDLSQSGLKDLRGEIHNMKSLRHPNCLKLFEVVKPPGHNHWYLITEFAKGGDLCGYMNAMTRDQHDFNEAFIGEMMKHAMHGVAFLHAHGVVHHDLRPENILVMERYIPRKERAGGVRMEPPRVVIANYKCAMAEHEADRISFGDPRYMSPEAVLSKAACFQSGQKIITSGRASVDIWAMGVTIYQFLGKGLLPFLYQECPLAGLQSVVLRLHAALKSKEPVRFSEDDNGQQIFSANARHLLLNMLQKQVDQRIVASDVLTHPWFTDFVSKNRMSKSSGNVKFNATRNHVRQILRSAVASKLGFEHVAQSYEIFKVLDPDNSGSISKDEFKMAISQVAPAFKHQADKYFAWADVDKNGTIEFNEFAAINLDWDELSTGVLDQHLGDLFDRLDVGAREVPVFKFQQLLRKVAGPVEGLREAIQISDKDNDGMITLEELKQFVRGGARVMDTDLSQLHPGLQRSGLGR